jgi:hypothetical protein
MVAMAIQRDATEERQARLDTLIEQLRAAEKRQLLKRGIALWTRTEADEASPYDVILPEEKIN